MLWLVAVGQAVGQAVGPELGVVGEEEVVAAGVAVGDIGEFVYIRLDARSQFFWIGWGGRGGCACVWRDGHSNNWGLCIVT